MIWYTRTYRILWNTSFVLTWDNEIIRKIITKKLETTFCRRNLQEKNNTTARQETVGLEGLELNNEPYITVANPIKL